MVTETTKYIAEDGTAFDTVEEAQAYEDAQALRVQVEAYISAAGLERAAAGFARKHFPQFQSYVKRGIEPPREVKKEKAKPAADEGGEDASV